MFLDPGNSRNGSLSLSRRMQRLRGNDGLIVGVAIDHRESLRAAFARSEIPDPSKASIAAFKAAVIETLAGMASVVLLDRLYGSAALTHLPARVALAMPLEADGYESVGDVRLTRMDPGFSPIKASRYGADATKLLVPYRPDIQETARHQEGIVRGAIERSHRYGLPVIVEPVV